MSDDSDPYLDRAQVDLQQAQQDSELTIEQHYVAVCATLHRTTDVGDRTIKRLNERIAELERDLAAVRKSHAELANTIATKVTEGYEQGWQDALGTRA